jgi:hypothetical protein
MSLCTGRGNQKGINLETTHMMSVVEKLSLDHLVDEKRRGMYNDHAGFDGQRSPNIMDIRKQILGIPSYWLLIISTCVLCIYCNVLLVTVLLISSKIDND